MEYPKTQTLWKRDPDTGIILPGQYSREEFRNIKWWYITEKIDGMNIRVIYEKRVFINYPLPATVTFAGRTDRAILPKELLENLQKIFTVEKMEKQFPDSHYVTLFGEGYGPGIQKGGGLYRDDKNFILFDVYIDGWWLTQINVAKIASEMNISRVPSFGIWTIQRILDFIHPRVDFYHPDIEKVNGIPQSIISKHPKDMEGVMCRSNPLMLFRNGKPLMFKLKVKDYQRLLNLL